MWLSWMCAPGEWEMVQVTPLASLMLLVAFMCVIVSEDAKDCKGAKQNTLRFQSLGLAARLDRGLITREDTHEGNDDGEDDEGDDLAVHAPIIAYPPANATPCTCFHAHFCSPNPLPPMHLGHRRI